MTIKDDELIIIVQRFLSIALKINITFIYLSSIGIFDFNKSKLIMKIVIKNNLIFLKKPSF